MSAAAPRPKARAQLITDGTAVLAHDRADVWAVEAAFEQYHDLAATRTQAQADLVTGGALIRDMAMGFLQPYPRVDPPTALQPGYDLNEALMAQITQTAEWEATRAAGTVGDPLYTAIAVQQTAEGILNAVDQATRDRVKQITADAAAIDDLLRAAGEMDETAATLDDADAAAMQAEAEAARQAAAATQQRLTTEQEALTAQLPAVEDAARRAARVALAACAEEVEAIEGAGAAFGGYGRGLGSGQGGMPAKEKMAIAKKLRTSRRLKDLVELVGRMKALALAVHRQQVDQPPSEVVSVRLGSDLAHLLGSEMARLSDPLLEDDWVRRYLDNGLHQYHLKGHEKQARGPVILFQDQSGSMSGRPDLEATAVALAIAAICALEHRDLYIYHFGSTGELKGYKYPNGHLDPARVMAMAEHFYGGGTDFDHILRQAMQDLATGEWARADVIFVTDGMAAIDPALLAAWNAFRTAKHVKAFGVIIGTSWGLEILKSMADYCAAVKSLADDTAALTQLFSV